MIQGHGGNVAAVAQELGCSPADITDMSSNINPLGSMPGLMAHLRERMDRIRVLPEVDAGEAIRGIGAFLGVDSARILAGAGTTQFIYCACAALTSRKVLIVGPTYADYADGCRMHGIEPDFFLVGAETGFWPDLDRLDQALLNYDTVFLCNPNNPTGQLLLSKDLLGLCERHPQVRFLVDESYLPFVADKQGEGLCHCELANVIVLWSVSKIFGMPGLRAGFLIAQPPTIAAFQRYMQPWSVNSLAQDAVCFLAEHAIKVRQFVARTHRYLQEEGGAFCGRLQWEGLTVYPSWTSYFLIRLPPTHDAETVCAFLRQQRFLIRNCANFHGLDQQYIRIALKDPESNRLVCQHLLAALTQTDRG